MRCGMLNRMSGAFGLSETPRVAHVFLLLSLVKPRRLNDCYRHASGIHH
jgi:hypothetical protein